MVAFGHTAVGSLVGIGAYSLISNNFNIVEGLLVTGTIGVISHYLFDAIPHGHFFDEKNFKKWIFWDILFDLLLSIVVFAGIVYLNHGVSDKLWYVLFGIGGSQLPDVLGGLNALHMLPKKGLLKLENHFHWFIIHWHGALMWRKSDIWQITVLFIALYFTLIF